MSENIEKKEVKTENTGDRARKPMGDRPRRRPMYQKKRKVCWMCKEGLTDIDYKDVESLKRYVTERQKIKPRKISGTCARHQRIIAKRIKMARNIALLPYKA